MTMVYLSESYVLDFLADQAGMSSESPLDTLCMLEDMTAEEGREAVEVYVHDLFLNHRSI